MIKFFGFRTARSTAPIPVRSLGGADSIPMFFFKIPFYLWIRRHNLHPAFFLQDYVKVDGTLQKVEDISRFGWLTNSTYEVFTLSINSDNHVRFAGYMFNMFFTEKIDMFF